MNNGLPTGWQMAKLGDVCTKVGSGATPRGGEDVYIDNGTALIRSQNVYNDGFHHDGLAHVGNDHAEELENVTVEAGDVLLNITGDSVARCCLAPTDVLPARVNQHVAIIRPRSDALDRRFLRYVFVSPDMQAHMLALAGAGATRDALTKGMIESFWVPCPPLHEQETMACVLGTLDDKIELNRRMNQTLEQIARAIFKSWFVDFDPVRAKAAELIAEGTLEIGDGYRAKNTELAAEGLPFVRAGDLQTGFDLDGAERLGPASLAKAAVKISRPGDVAFTSKGTVGRLARVADDTPQFVYSPQICFWRTLNANALHPAILYCWMCSEDFMRQVRAVSGQTDMAPYISLRDQRQLTIPRFPANQHDIGERIAPFLKRQSTAAGESRTLAAIRDALLPKLLSGEIRVRDAEKVVGKAV